jgi:hypothetical protein
MRPPAALRHSNFDRVAVFYRCTSGPPTCRKRSEYSICDSERSDIRLGESIATRIRSQRLHVPRRASDRRGDLGARLVDGAHGRSRAAAAPGDPIVGLALIGLHNTTDGVPAETFGKLAWLWRVLHVSDLYAESVVRIDYTIIPWAGVMAVGYALGPLMQQPAAYL